MVRKLHPIGTDALRTLLKCNHYVNNYTKYVCSLKNCRFLHNRGWIGFNAGSSYGVTGGKWELAARAGAGTTLASMSAGMTSILFSLAKHNGKVDVFEVISGILSGLGEKI